LTNDEDHGPREHSNASCSLSSTAPLVYLHELEIGF